MSEVMEQLYEWWLKRFLHSTVIFMGFIFLFNVRTKPTGLSNLIFVLFKIYLFKLSLIILFFNKKRPHYEVLEVIVLYKFIKSLEFIIVVFKFLVLCNPLLKSFDIKKSAFPSIAHFKNISS